jgi:excisionase family DNA binding protein
MAFLTTGKAEVLTIEEVAQVLRCSKAHVYNIIAGRVRGVDPLPVLALGRRRLVLRSTLEQWQSDSQKVAPGAILTASPEVDAVDA